MKSKAVFIGKNGSMGLRNGMLYEFELKTDRKFIWIIINGILFNRRIPYETMRALLKNWRF